MDNEHTHFHFDHQSSSKYVERSQESRLTKDLKNQLIQSQEKFESNLGRNSIYINNSMFLLLKPELASDLTQKTKRITNKTTNKMAEIIQAIMIIFDNFDNGFFRVPISSYPISYS